MHNEVVQYYQFCSHSQYEKSRKRQQKLAKQQARDTERDAQKRAVLYTLRVQDMLNSMGDVDKENFRAGSNGAVVRKQYNIERGRCALCMCVITASITLVLQ